MIQVPCPICRTDDFIPLHTARDFISDQPGEFNLVRCASCGLVYLNPRPDPGELGAYYDDPYRLWQSASESGLQARFRRMGARRKLKAVEVCGARGRLLDVGCGNGDFLLEAGLRGWDAAGTEFDAQQAGYAARRSGADVRPGELSGCGFGEGSFDVITMWHVLEHMPDPLATLEAALSLLKPGGFIFVAVPDCSSWAARLFGRHWAGYDAPRHLQNFPAGTLKKTLTRAGFNNAGATYFMGTYDNVKISLDFLIKDRVSRPGARRALLLLAGNPLARVLLTPVAMLLQRLDKGTVVTVRAQKG